MEDETLQELLEDMRPIDYTEILNDIKKELSAIADVLHQIRMERQTKKYFEE